jgi:methyl-accepting chemotaxis protein
MNRLSVQGKMALLGVIAMVPVIVLAYMLNERIEGEINFTRKETQTVPMVMPARQLMQAVQAHRGVSQTVIGGNSALAGRLSELQAKVAAALKDGDAADARTAQRSARPRSGGPASGLG